ALKRLGHMLDRWNDAAAAWESAIMRAPESDTTLRAALLGELASIYDGSMGDVERATKAYERLLDVDSNNAATSQPAAQALERLHGERHEHRDLIEILRRRVELAKEPGARRALLWRVAELHEGPLTDVNEAIAAYLEILDAAPDDAGALAELARLYRAQERW